MLHTYRPGEDLERMLLNGQKKLAAAKQRKHMYEGMNIYTSLEDEGGADKDFIGSDVYEEKSDADAAE